MKKQEYIDIGIQNGLTLSQIESVLLRVLGISAKELFLLQDISSKYIYEIQKYFYDLKSGKPQEYAVQKATFYGKDFFVDERVLIPRNDTEILVSQMIQYILLHPESTQGVYIDVGTGSGCIALSLLQEILPLKFFKAYGLDISPAALEVAQKNMQSISGIFLELLHSNLLEKILQNPSLQGKSFFISANLPYIKDNDHENMDASVIRHEPHTALFGGKNTGFELYEQLLKQCFQMQVLLQSTEIHLFIEIGYDQYEYSKKILGDFGLRFEYFQDSASIYRVIHISGF